jgi:thioredoxin-related protein
MRVLFCLLLFVSIRCFAGDTTRLYDPRANVQKDMAEVLQRAKAQHKNVFIQVGSNSCVWCYVFNSFIYRNPTLKKQLLDNYLVYHLNHSPENKNLDYLQKLGSPQRFGLPVFVILDENGNELWIQDSSGLISGNGYGEEKLAALLGRFTPGSSVSTAGTH